MKKRWKAQDSKAVCLLLWIQMVKESSIRSRKFVLWYLSYSPHGFPISEFCIPHFWTNQNNWFTNLIEITLNPSECMHFISFENLWFGIRNWGNHLMNCLLRSHLRNFLRSLTCRKETKHEWNDWMWSFQQFTPNFHKKFVRNFMFWL